MKVPQWLFEVSTLMVGIVVGAALHRAGFPLVGTLLGGAATIICIRGLKQHD
jgi:uncharacterized membrane protein AbrB (regulator of aidB expression)